MNPLTNMKNVTKLSEQELRNSGKSSWHDQYRDSAWIFIGGLPYDLTEGDIICIFSQYGEIVNINLIRDKDTGKSKGFCFLCYEDQRSTVLSVDNLNGIKVLNRILRVDHVSEYKIPKEGKKTGEETKKLYNEGCAPKPFVPVVKNPLIENPEFRRETLADQIQANIKLPARLPIRSDIKQEIITGEPVNVKIENIKREKSVHKKHSNSEDRDSTDSESRKKTKKRNHRTHTSSESERESEKKYMMNRSDPLSSDKKSKYKNRSKHEEGMEKQSNRRRSRSRSSERKPYRDDKRKKHSISNSNKYNKSRRRSRS